MNTSRLFAAIAATLAALALPATAHAAVDKQTRLIDALEHQSHVSIAVHRDYRYTIVDRDGTVTRTKTLTEATDAVCGQADEYCQDFMRTSWDVRYVHPADLFHHRVAWLQAHLPSCSQTVGDCSSRHGVTLSGVFYAAG